VIEVHELSKSYRGKVVVDRLSFTVEPGRVTGFLGPNGAGKSTTMRLIVGLDHPTGGTATINGRRYAELSRPLMRVGALLDADAVHPGRSAYNHLLFLAQSQGLPRRRVGAVLDLVGLHDVVADRAGTFSLGMRQRLGIAVALLGDPAVLILDEPINGLDPDGIFWIRNLMKSLAAEGRTVFVSSHLMGEMAVTADHLIVIGRGRLIAESSTQELIDRSSHKSVLVKSAGFQIGQLAVCVLGVLVVTGEYSSGTIRASLLAVPTRSPVLAAKAAIFAILIFVVGELTAVPTFFLGAAILHSRAPVSIGDPGVLRAVVGAGLYLAVLAVFAVAIGALVRHTAGAITGIVAFVLVLSPLTLLLPGSVGKHIHAYLPSEAGSLVASPHQGVDDLLTPWQGFSVFCLETAVLVAAVAYLLRRRDA